MSGTVQETIDELRRTLTDYIEATYHIGHPLLLGQRKRLLAKSGGIFQIPYLESTPRYVAGDSYRNMPGLPDAAREAFVQLADPAGGKPVIFDPPYAHQAEAIQQTLANRKNLMIMTGTGSGKTESFLLPILGKLAIEARDHSSQFNRFHAVRAIVLYPMNALVNDQLGRLRLAFRKLSRGIDVRGVVRQARAGCPLYQPDALCRRSLSGKRWKPSGTSIGDFFAAIEEGAERHRDWSPANPRGR